MKLILPRHLGVIIDGNRRWAKERGLPPWEGHWKGAEKVEKFLDWCMELGIPQVSIYALSTENLRKRPKRELKELFKIFYHYLDKWERRESDFLKKYRVRVRFVGDLDKLPKRLVKLMGRIMEKTAKYQKRVINFLVAYGGKYEIVRAVKNLVEECLRKHRLIEINEREFEKKLMVPSGLDLLIRTGGEKRLSNFMPWQACYAELIFLNKYWPDFTKRDLILCLKEFSRRQRRFGK